VDFIVGESAFSKHEYVGIGDLLLDLRPPFPPPAHHIHTVRILGKEAGEGFRIVVVASLLQACLHFMDCNLILAPVGAERRHSQSCD